jgi:RNA exonuclease 4
MTSTSEANTATITHLAHDTLGKKIAIECEMMQSNIGEVLSRVSVVNYKGATTLDTFV